MLYLHDGHIRGMGVDWHKLTDLVKEAVRIKAEGDCAFPLKPYLRFKDPVNRIIAMPAYAGGSIRRAGIKWIASFPGNHRDGLPRAHNTIILNDPDTGRPTAFFYCGLLNALRTAAVSGAMLKAYRAVRPSAACSLGIIGWGPIGRTHLDMAAALLGERLERVRLYDRRPIDPETIPPALRSKTEIAEDWRSVYRSSDIFATCTVSPDRYIDEPPPPGTLLLNVSLRDYQPESVAGIRAVVVDDWQEICRENTDIERLHLKKGLQPEGALLLEDVLWGSALSRYAPDEPVFFNPMGLAIFDMAIAGFYHDEALRLGRGIELEEPPAP